ncbi:Rossmann-like domain-containing protein [Thermodesulfobacteriota bacterium]
METIYNEIRKRALDIIDRDLLDKKVKIKARALSPEEAIGNPESDDYPLIKGRERLMQADLESSSGQAFTDQYGNFEGYLRDILESEPVNNYKRAILIASLNAALKHMELIRGTTHCKDEEPAECAVQLAKHIESVYGKSRIIQIGFQPRFVEELAKTCELRVIDLDIDNIGTTKFNTLIEGPEKTDEAVNWADLLLVTGTTITNGTIEIFLGKKPVLFYGITISGAAYLMDWDRFCYKGR